MCDKTQHDIIINENIRKSDRVVPIMEDGGK